MYALVYIDQGQKTSVVSYPTGPKKCSNLATLNHYFLYNCVQKDTAKKVLLNLLTFINRRNNK